MHLIWIGVRRSHHRVRAREPLLQQLRKDMQSNGYWTGLLAAGWDERVKFNRARNFEHVLQAVTVQDVAAVARKYLGDHMVRVETGS